MTSNDAQDKAAKVIEEYNNEGKPFVLYLRKFDIDILHGKNKTERYLIDNYLVNNLPQDVNVIAIHNSKEGVLSKLPYDFPAYFRNVPSLNLPDTTWEVDVEQLIERSDLIVSECIMLSPGVKSELYTCHKHNKNHQTVLILPPPQSSVRTIDDDKLIQMFPRCIWANEFFTIDLLDSFVIKDLLERIKVIGRLSKEERIKLLDPRERLLRYPITYSGVVEGYISHARRAELGDLLNDENDKDDLWHYEFWDYFRAHSILTVRLMSGEMKIEQIAHELINCYLNMGYLMLKGKKEDDKIIIQGDIDFANKCAVSAYSFASQCQIPYLIRMSENLLAEIDKLERAITANKDLFILRPLIKSIVTWKGSLETEKGNDKVTEKNLTLFKDYDNSTYGFKMLVPLNWAEMDVPESTGITCAFQAPSETLADTYQLNAVLHVTVVNLPTTNNSLDDLTQLKLRFNFPGENDKIIQSGPTMLANSPAYLSVKESSAMIDIGMGNSQKQMEIWTIYGDKWYVISFAAPIDKYDQYLPMAEKMINSFEIKP
jgi:hypothetical protein